MVLFRVPKSVSFFLNTDLMDAIKRQVGVFHGMKIQVEREHTIFFRIEIQHD
jgi:hypothetical protein